MRLPPRIETARLAVLAHPWRMVAVLLLLAAVLCFDRIAAQPLWNDEAFSFFVAHHGLWGTLQYIRQDSQPPLYYLVLSGWMGLAGHGVAALRALSALAMLASVPVLFDAARRLLGPGTALFGTLLFVMAPESVGWAQIARPYALQTLLVAVSFWGFVRIWLAWDARRRAPAAGWLAYALGGGLAVLAQYPAVFFLVACNLAMAVRALRAGRREGLALARRWALGQFWLALVWLPWLAYGVQQVLQHLTPREMAMRHSNYLVSAADTWTRVADRFAIADIWRGRWVFVALIGGLALAGSWRLLRAPREGLPVLAVVFVPLGVCVAAFYLLHPVFGYVIYTFGWLQLGTALLLASGGLALRPRWLGAAALGLLLLGDGWGLLHHRAAPHVPLDRVAALIGTQARAGDGILLSSEGAARWGLAYYLGPPYEGRLAGLGVAVEAMTGWPIATPAQALRQRRLWVVLPQGETPPFDPATLAPSMRLRLRERIGPVLVERYDAGG